MSGPSAAPQRDKRRQVSRLQDRRRSSQGIWVHPTVVAENVHAQNEVVVERNVWLVSAPLLALIVTIA